MIDILISLFLIFALFSGLVSGVSEIISQILEMRGRVLFEGIAMLLGELEGSSKIRRWSGLVDSSIKVKVIDKNAKESKTELVPRAGLTKAVYSHPLIDTLSQPGSKPSYINPSCFSEALTQTLSSGGSLADLRKSLDDRVTPLGQLFGPMLDQANGDINQFKAQVEAHFTLVMDRVGGWYKRRSQAIMFVIGLLLAILLNVDTIYISKQFGANPALVAQLVQTANNINEKTSSIAKDPNVSQEDINSVKALEEKVSTLTKQLNTFDSIALPVGWNNACNSDKPSFICRLTGNHLNSSEGQDFFFLGWLLTALAATLGAPFWFDAISKLFAIRGTGVKPESSKAANTEITTQTASLSNLALPKFRSDLPQNDYESSRLNSEDIDALQRALGLPEEKITGKFNEEMRSALRNWQRDKQEVTGRFDEKTVLSLIYGGD